MSLIARTYRTVFVEAPQAVTAGVIGTPISKSPTVHTTWSLSPTVQHTSRVPL